MKRVALLFFLPIAAFADVDLRWTVESSRPTPYQAQVYQGETVKLTATLKDYSSPIALADGATASFYWQTNGMAQAWWTTNATVNAASGTVSATWSPLMDVGADAYSFFMRVDDAGASYRANGIIRMAKSPGATPNALPLPRQSLDFDTIDVINPPWDSSAKVDIDRGYAKELALVSAAGTSAISFGRGDARHIQFGSFFDGVFSPAFGYEFPTKNGTFALADDTVERIGGNARNLAIVSDSGATAIQFGRADVRILEFGGYDNGSFSPSFAYELPTKSGTIALLDDIPQAQNGGTYASPTFRYISTEPYITGEDATDANVQDYVEARTVAGGLLAVRLSAVSEERPDADAGEVAGTFSIVGGTSPYATLTNDCVLLPTGTSGPVTVEFTPADGSSALRKKVSMTRGNAQMVLYSPSAEQDGTWRREQGDALAELFRGISTNGIASTYRHGRGNETNTYCRGILMAQQLYVTNEVANPSVVNSTFFSPEIANAIRCQSVGRTDFGTGPTVRPAMFIAPHYAICANHYPPSSAKFCLDRAQRTFKTYAFSKVANNGDLCLLRTATDAFPTDLIPAMLRPAVLSQFSPSMLLGTVGFYQSQHGTVHPCLVTPNDGIGWSTTRPGNSFRNYGLDGVRIRNATYADLDVYGHDVHGGDSGHAVCLWINGLLVPVGTFYSAGGSGQSLVDDAILDWLDNAIRQDSGGTESLTYLTAADLEL